MPANIRRPDLLAGGTVCMVCNRQLRHPASVRMGMGLTCAKNFRGRLDTIQRQPEYRQAIESWRQHRDEQGEVALYRAGEFVLESARQEHRARMLYTTTGAAMRRLEHGTAEVPSFERGRGAVQFYQTTDPNVALAMSDSGKSYAMALSADHSHATWCSCPSQLYSPEPIVCRHMQAFDQAAGAQRQQDEQEFRCIEAERQERRTQVEQATQGILERLDQELVSWQRKAERGRITPAIYEQKVREIEETRAVASAIAYATTSRVTLANVAQAMLDMQPMGERVGA